MPIVKNYIEYKIVGSIVEIKIDELNKNADYKSIRHTIYDLLSDELDIEGLIENLEVNYAESVKKIEKIYGKDTPKYEAELKKLDDDTEKETNAVYDSLDTVYFSDVYDFFLNKDVVSKVKICKIKRFDYKSRSDIIEWELYSFSYLKPKKNTTTAKINSTDKEEQSTKPKKTYEVFPNNKEGEDLYKEYYKNVRTNGENINGKISYVPRALIFDIDDEKGENLYFDTKLLKSTIENKPCKGNPLDESDFKYFVRIFEYKDYFEWENFVNPVKKEKTSQRKKIYFEFPNNQTGADQYQEYYTRIRTSGRKTKNGRSYVPYGLTFAINDKNETVLVFQHFLSKDKLYSTPCRGDILQEPLLINNKKKFGYESKDDYEYENNLGKYKKKNEINIATKEFEKKLQKEKLEEQAKKNLEQKIADAHIEAERLKAIAQERINSKYAELKSTFSKTLSNRHIISEKAKRLPDKVKINASIPHSSMVIRPFQDIFKKVDNFIDQTEKDKLSRTIEYLKEDKRKKGSNKLVTEVVYLVSKSTVLEHLSVEVNLDEKFNSKGVYIGFKGKRTRTQKCIERLRKKIKLIKDSIYNYTPRVVTGEITRESTLTIAKIKKQYINDMQYQCQIAATFFQILVSWTPIDENYSYKARKINKGSSPSSLYKVRKDGSISKRQLKEPNLTSKKVTHIADEIKVRADWILTVNGINFKAFKSEQADYNDPIPRGAVTNQFREEDFIYTGDENAIKEITLKIYEKVMKKKPTEIKWSYKNINPRWELLEKGGYEYDTVDENGNPTYHTGLSQYGFKHGIKNHFTYQAPNGFISLTEAYYMNQVGKNRGYITKFLNNKGFNIDIQDTDSEFINKLKAKYKNIGTLTFTDKELEKEVHKI